MASTSISSIQKSFKYDVFLSFRGEDTRKNFVDHLFHALQQKGITTYKDDERIEKGESISDQLITSIEDARFCIIVFSRNYASSSWCLDELVKIMECQRTTEQTAYPVFYDVKPTEVRNQIGPVGEAFAKYVGTEAAWRWRDALKEAACLAGWELKNTVDGHEAKFIQKIVKDISLKPHFINSSIDGKLVGLETRVKEVVSSLEIDSDDVRMIGIRGMGGGGKTTLARAVFEYISLRFDRKSFVCDVREGSKGIGLKGLQQQILQDVLNDQNINVKSVHEGKYMMNKMMLGRTLLLVLDDVDDIQQLKALAGDPTWFKPGSRIIITTRDEQVLTAHRVNFVHNVHLFSEKEAISMFSRYAFGGEKPIQGYEELLRKVISYAAGLPLTLSVLGSFLCGRTPREWEDALERLKTIPEDQTLKRLELSYNDLESDHKEIFLDVACILKGAPKKKAIKILESCGFNAEIGLSVLEQSRNGLEYCRLNPHEPSKHNQLWIKEEIEEILVNELGTKATRSLKLKSTYLSLAIVMKGLRKMKQLRFISIENETWEVNEASPYLPDTLQYLHWPQYPFSCLPNTFQATKLANLQMRSSNISQLWETGGRKVLKKLRFLDLGFSKLGTLDLAMTPNIEELYLVGCNEFVELYVPVECLTLEFLDLSCSKVRSFNVVMTPNLKTLYLGGCNEFVELHMPNECLNLEFVDLSGSKVSNFNLGITPNLKTLNLGGCDNFVELHTPEECFNLEVLNLTGSKVRNFNLGMTPNLKILYLVGCSEFVELHMPAECLNLEILNLSGSKVVEIDLGIVPNLNRLDLKGCYDFLEIHIPVECMNLKFLDLSGSKISNLNLEMTPNLNKLYLKGCSEFTELHIPVECVNLKFLDFRGSKVSSFNLEMTPNLIKLDLKGCTEFIELHIPVECLNLEFLDLGGSKVSNLNLGLTPNLSELHLEECYCLQKIHAPVGCLKKLVCLNISGCSRFKSFLVDKQHVFPNPNYVTELELSAKSLDICPLHPNNNLPKFQFECEYDEPGSPWSGNIEKLLSFGLCACTNLETFSTSICSLLRLRVLRLKVSIPEAPKDLCKLKSLEKLSLWMNMITHLPDSICLLKNLKCLDLESCHLLEQLPMDLWRLEGLEELDLRDCRTFQDIPNSICYMKCLKYLYLTDCISVKKLPELIGRIECLKELDIKGTGITNLPYSIFQIKGLKIVWSEPKLKSHGLTVIYRPSQPGTPERYMAYSYGH